MAKRESDDFLPSESGFALEVEPEVEPQADPEPQVEPDPQPPVEASEKRRGKVWVKGEDGRLVAS